MDTIQLQNAIRQGGSDRKERLYFDFIISGISLKKILAIEGSDRVTLLGWEGYAEQDQYMSKVFKLQKRSPLSTGRVVLYGCPECGDIDCGAITVSILDLGYRIMWKDFDHETGYGGLEDLYPHIKPIEFSKRNYFEVFSGFKYS